jgi:nicotinate-nucleotide adenylyltransferase
VDIDRDKPTYTVDTLTDLKNSYPDAELFFITGSDAIAQILAWKEVQRLWDLAHFVAVSRPGHALQIPDVPEGTVTVVEVPALSISSTDCRNRVSNGEPIWYLVPDGVVQYIGKHGLYKGLS